MFEEQRIIFTCSQPKLINNKKSNEMKKYRNEIDLFGNIKYAFAYYTLFLNQVNDCRWSVKHRRRCFLCKQKLSSIKELGD